MGGFDALIVLSQRHKHGHVFTVGVVDLQGSERGSEGISGDEIQDLLFFIIIVICFTTFEQHGSTYQKTMVKNV